MNSPPPKSLRSPSPADGGGGTADADDMAPLQLDRFVPYRLSILTLAVSRSLARLYSRQFNLTVPEWRAMAALGCDQPLSANEICARSNMDKVQVSRAITRMLRSGLVIRHQDSTDRRRSVLWLSDKGMGVYRRIVPLARGREAELLKVLTGRERQQLDRLLDKLTEQAFALQDKD